MRRAMGWYILLDTLNFLDLDPCESGSLRNSDPNTRPSKNPRSTISALSLQTKQLMTFLTDNDSPLGGEDIVVGSISLVLNVCCDR